MRRTATAWILAGLAAALLVLCCFGAAALWRGDHPTVGLIAFAQMPIYGIAAWLVIVNVSSPVVGPFAGLLQPPAGVTRSTSPGPQVFG